MKKKIKLVDTDGKVIEKEYSVRQKGQYDTLLKYKSSVFRDKKKYSRKQKHKKGIDFDSL